VGSENVVSRKSFEVQSEVLVSQKPALLMRLCERYYGSMMVEELDIVVVHTEGYSWQV
jgi:hypothetical protein